MSDKPDNTSAQEMSRDEFFDTNSTNRTSASADPAYDIGDQLKDGLRQAGMQAGSSFLINAIVNLLPLPYRHKRNITRKIQRGESITIWDILFGGLTIGRIISFVISLIVFGIIVFFMISQGLT